MSKKIIIVDIEWNNNGPIDSPPLLQLGAVKIGRCEQVLDSFFSFIKPSNEISDLADILRIMPFTSEALLSGKDISDVLCEFSHWCGSVCSFVLWGSYNCRVFSNISSGYFPIDRFNTLDLQLVCSIISGTAPVSLDNACICSETKVYYPLHNALKDAQTLTELYKTLNVNYDLEDIMQQFLINKKERIREKRRAKRKRQSQKKAMIAYQYILDLGSGAVHKKGCPVLQNILSQLKGFETFKGALKEGTKLCPLCFDENISFDHDFTVSEKVRLINLHHLCANLNIRSKNQGRLFSMITDVGRWLFIFGEIPTVYHHNNIYPSKNIKGFNPYHKQPGKFASYEDMIQYIYKHDRKTISTYR